jgi:DNA polymerase I-like protein with 3'-5' exonuclease and polymerase domains
MVLQQKLLFQVHDSLVFDIHPEEEFIIPTLKKISQSYKGMDLPISLRIGDNYRDGTKKNM